MKSQTPTWAIIVAILMMLVGGCGIKNDVQSINIRSFLAMKDKIIDKIETKKNKSAKDDSDSLNIAQDEAKEIKVDSSEYSLNENEEIRDSITSDTLNSENEINIKDMFGAMLNVPEETIVSIIRFGYIGLFFSLLFVIGGLFLLIKKKFSISLAYGAIGANILFSIIRWTMLSGKGGTLLAIGNSIGAAFTIFVSLILFIVIISCDKSHYEEIYSD